MLEDYKLWTILVDSSLFGFIYSEIYPRTFHCSFIEHSIVCLDMVISGRWTVLNQCATKRIVYPTKNLTDTFGIRIILKIKPEKIFCVPPRYTEYKNIQSIHEERNGQNLCHHERGLEAILLDTLLK